MIDAKISLTISIHITEFDTFGNFYPLITAELLEIIAITLAKKIGSNSKKYIRIYSFLFKKITPLQQRNYMSKVRKYEYVWHYYGRFRLGEGV